jgi:hypothetical protein
MMPTVSKSDFLLRQSFQSIELVGYEAELTVSMGVPQWEVDP